jgi:hypothetical protein
MSALRLWRSIRTSLGTTHLDNRRALLLTCSMGGALVPLYFLHLAAVSHLGWDFHAYYAAATAALAGEPFMASTPDSRA